MDVTLQRCGPDTVRVHELVDELPDRDDGSIVLVDGCRHAAACIQEPEEST